MYGSDFFCAVPLCASGDNRTVKKALCVLLKVSVDSAVKSLRLACKAVAEVVSIMCGGLMSAFFAVAS